MRRTIRTPCSFLRAHPGKVSRNFLWRAELAPRHLFYCLCKSDASVCIRGLAKIEEVFYMSGGMEMSGMARDGWWRGARTVEKLICCLGQTTTLSASGGVVACTLDLGVSRLRPGGALSSSHYCDGGYRCWVDVMLFDLRSCRSNQWVYRAGLAEVVGCKRFSVRASDCL